MGCAIGKLNRNVGSPPRVNLFGPEGGDTRGEARHYYPNSDKETDGFIAYTGRSSKDVKSGPRYRRRVSMTPSIEVIAEEGRGTAKKEATVARRSAERAAQPPEKELKVPEEKPNTRRVSVGTEENEKLMLFYKARLKPRTSDEEIEIASTIITTPSEYSTIVSKQRLSIDSSYDTGGSTSDYGGVVDYGGAVDPV